ncbi:MAG: hypothetical protein AAGA99_20400 [Actinomycetota bacterium]
MEILAALFVENFDIRQAAGGAARLDLGGAHFSFAAPSEPPVSIEPHLIVIVRCPADHSGMAALEVVFMRGDEQVARNVQPLQVEPGKFNYRLVKGELTFESYETIEAHCRIDQGDPIVVPLTILPPA